MGKGYKLTSAEGDGPKQCAFFFSDQGCRNGANCKFSHDTKVGGASPAAKAPNSVSSSSVMSSESESDGEIIETERRAGAYASLVKKGDDSNPFFSSPATAAASSAKKSKKEEQSTDKKKDKKRKKSDTPSDLVTETQTPKASQKGPSPATAISSPVAAAPPKKSKQAVTTPSKSNTLPPTNTSSFRDLNLPVAAFSLPIGDDSIKETTPETPRPPTPQHEEPPPLPLPVATPAHRKWHSAVLATRSHPNYSAAFSFAKTQQAESEQGISTPGQWITSRPYGEWCANNPASIAIDCEMCETKDPVTGKNDTKALCRLSVVNADDPKEVLLDTLVKPDWPVVDYRTWVNGIKKKDLEGVEFTLRHAQMFMDRLCSEQTVVVGHAVHNDLLALKMIHHCNVDTALLFKNKDEGEENTNSTPSLKNLAHGVMKRAMPDVHDSVNDARVALLCADHYVTKNGEVDPVEKVFTRSHSRGGGGRLQHADTSMLLVHRLPTGSTSNHVADMLLAFTNVKPKNVAEITFSGKHGKCNVEFMTKEHAELAYLSLAGDEKEDKTGKKQKRVKMKNGDYVCVRKMKK